jgi:hypothetical protein
MRLLGEMYASCPELILRLLSYFVPILLPTKIAQTASVILSSIHLLIQPSIKINARTMSLLHMRNCISWQTGILLNR